MKSVFLLTKQARLVCEPLICVFVGKKQELIKAILNRMARRSTLVQI